VKQDCNKARLRQNCDKCDRLPIYNILYNIAITSFFNIIDREAKKLLPCSIFVITGYYKRVEISVVMEELSPNKKL